MARWVARRRGLPAVSQYRRSLVAANHSALRVALQKSKSATCAARKSEARYAASTVACTLENSPSAQPSIEFGSVFESCAASSAAGE